MKTIEALRKQIEEIDSCIIKNLAKRQEISKKIGQLKLEEGKNISDPLREESLYAYYETLSAKYQLETQFIQDLFKCIINHSKQIQKPMDNKTKN